jgi:adhesin transport system outer membrane protein
MKRHFLLGLSLASLCVSGPALAAPKSATLSGPALAAQQAIESSPEVAAKLNALRSAAAETDVARSGFMPRVDLSAETGRTQDHFTNRRPQTESLSRQGVALTITQVLWDGGATSKEVDRLDHNRMARFFELLDTTELIALEAVRAYQDVARYRRLVDLAEDNYVQHRLAFDQIQSRVKAGVGRGVDQDQAGARLALAESNLITERANLHDVTERYRRIVGALPPAQTPADQALTSAVPASNRLALEQAARNSPVIAAAIEAMRAARAQAEGRKSAYMPRLEARVRSGQGRNLDGTEYQRRDVNAQVGLVWNLFNGGADQARQRQSAHLIAQASDLRDKACRDVRQTAAIAWNDTRKLAEQMGFLERNVAAIERARDAYRQQFEISQRSLLDLLNAENELYTARRAMANAQFDKQIAEVRTHAAMGTLARALGLSRADTSEWAPSANNWDAGEDASSRCPLTPTEVASLSREELDARIRVIRPPAASPAVSATSPAPAAAPVAATAAAPAAPAVNPADAASQRLMDWVAAWSSKNISAYMGFYAPNFLASKGSLDQWRAQRQKLVGREGPIRLQISELSTTVISATEVETQFRQRYESKAYSDDTTKVLRWALRDGTWWIIKESNR